MITRLKDLKVAALLAMASSSAGSGGIEEPASVDHPSNTETHRRNLRKIVFEAMLVATVAVMAAYCSWSVLRPLANNRERLPVVQRGMYGPCIQIAAGNGMLELPAEGAIPALDAYLEGRTPEFDTSLLADYAADQEHGGFGSSMHIYLLHSVGLALRLFGVNGWSVYVLCGFLHVMCASLLYGIFRLAMGRTLSFAGGILSASSPVYLSMCSELRDFGKAPWILAAILVLGVLIRFRHSGKGLLPYAVLLGVILGIGYGFRQDVLICLAPSLLVLTVAARVHGPRPLLWRAGATVTMVLLFLLLAQPVLRGKKALDQSISGHTMLQGLATKNEQTMAFGDASYEFNYTESDSWCIGLAQSYACRTGIGCQDILNSSVLYGYTGRQIFLDVFLQSPADLFSRGLASIAAAPKLLTSTWRHHPWHPYLESDPLDQFELLHAPVSNTLVSTAFLCMVLGFALLGMYDLRIALCTAFLFAYFGAYPSLLYVYRHAFYLSFLPYWFAGLCLSFLARGLRYAATQPRRGKKAALPPHSLRRLGQGLVFVLTVTLLVFGVLVSMLLVQRACIYRMASRYDNAALEPLPVEWERTEDGVLLSLPQSLCEMQGKPEPSLGDTASEYFVAVFHEHPQAVLARIQYEDRGLADFTREVLIPPGPGMRYFFPAIEGRWIDDPSRFRGLFIHGEGEACFEGLYRVANADTFRLWPFVMLPNSMDDFVWSKKGPLERTLLGWWVELRSGFGWSRENALSGYLELARLYPGHLPYTRRAFCLAARSGSFDEVSRVWDLVLSTDPRPLEEASRSLRGLGASGLLLPAELRSMEPIFEDRWSPPPRPRTIDSQHLLLEQGLALARHGNLTAAKAVYRRIMESDDCVLAHEELLKLYVDEGDYEGMEEEWRRAISARPGHPPLYRWLGWTLKHKGDLDGAIAAYRDALILEPRDAATRDALAGILLSKAESLSRQDDTEGAKAAYRRRIEFAPESNEAYRSLSDLFVSAGDLSGLKEEWRIAVQNHPGRALAHLSLGLALERHDELDNAILSYENALTLAPSETNVQRALARAWQTKANMLSDCGDLDDALRLFRRSREIWDSDPGPSQGEVQILVKAGRTEEARAAYREMIESTPHGYEAYDSLSQMYISSGDLSGLENEWRTAVQKNPERAFAQFSLGMALERQGHLDGAISAFESALALTPGEIVLKQALARALNEKARSLSDSGDQDGALRALKRSREMWDNNPGPSLLEAQVLVKGGHTEAGKSAYREIIDGAPKGRGAYDALSEVYVSAGDLSGLEEEWRTAVQNHPEWALTHFSLGLALEHQKNFAGAIAAYRNALSLEPEEAGTKKALAQAYQAKARSLTKSGEVEEALLLFEQSREVWSADPGPSLEEAEALVKGGQTEEGKTACREIIERTPNGYGAYDALSEVYVSAGDLKGLEEEWRTAVQEHPDRTLAHFSLGLALERQDDLDSAIAAYEEALRLDPQGGGTRQSLGRVLYDKAYSLESNGKHNELADVQRKLQSLGLAPTSVKERPGGNTTDQ